MILSLLLSLLATVTALPTSNVVKFQDATITGETLTNHYTFRGIRYAIAPTGNKRFKPPISPPKLTGTLTMKTFGPSCWQFTPDKSKISTPESEDCLSINVYVPKTPSVTGALKVLVWVHGGSNTSGSSSDPAEDMDNFPSDFIKVSFNYRLGAFGFLPGTQSFTERNAGLLDQKLAFEWVKANIASFGGDPNQITAIGVSAGANSIGTHMLALNGTQTLFSRAILISPPTLMLPFNPSVETAKREAIRATVNCKFNQGPSCLYAAPADLYASNATNFFYIPTVDRTYIAQDAFSAFSKKLYSKIPIHIHLNKDEGSVFGLVGTEAEAQALRRFQFPFFTETMQQTFDTMYTWTGPQSGGDLFGDVLFHCPATNILREYTAAGVPIYLSFNHHKNTFRPFGTSVPANIDIGVAHTSEMPHLFQLKSQIDASEVTFSKRVQETFLNFARGTPSTSGPLFTPYGINRNRYNLFLDPKDPLRKKKDGQRDLYCNVIGGFLNQIMATATPLKRSEIIEVLAKRAIQGSDSGFAQFGEIMTNMDEVKTFYKKNH
jgi:carboxylesterase type B